MKVTLTHDGKSVELDLTAEQMAALGLKEEKKKTGYERVERGQTYYTVWSDGFSGPVEEGNSHTNDDTFYTANYYSDSKLAKANARADRLMRELRRFAAENGGIPSVEDWNDANKHKHFIRYAHPGSCGISMYGISIDSTVGHVTPGVVYFNSRPACASAITIYHDELLWYFTEYEAMLR